MALVLFLSALLGAAGPVAARAETSFEALRIEKVPETEFEQPGYSWSIDFEDGQIEPGSDLVWKDDLSPYLPRRPGDESNPDSHWGVARSDGGWAAFVNDEATPESTDFTLRLTGGKYDDKAIDALVTISSWTYRGDDVDFDTGTALDWWEDFTPGVYMMRGYRSITDAKDGQGIQTLNFYTVGVDDIEVEVRFVLHGSDLPAEMRGHLTTTDLDAMQSFSFGGACTQARMSELNEHLYLNEDKDLIISPARNLDDKNASEWRDGMVEAYFDTTGDGSAEPLRFYFGTSFGAGGTPESVFFLCTEYVTVPPTFPDERIEHPVKTADPTTGVSVGDDVTFTVDAPMHEQGVNCRWGFKYTSCEIVDVLPPEMRYVEGSGRLLDEDGNDVTHLGTIAYDGDDSSPTENTVRFEFDREVLKTLELDGQHYRLVFDAELTEYPNSDLLKVTNNSYVRVNGGDDNPSTPVDVELLEPRFSVDKSADDYEWEVGDTVHFTVSYKQTVACAQSRQTVVSDNLPEYLELVGDSVRASGMKDIPAVEVNGNEWSISLDKLSYGDELTVEYDAVVRQSGNGREIINQASIHAINTPDEDDPEEIWANTSNVEVTKDVDRYEGYVGASDQDPGFFEYTVHATNTQAGTIANNVVITDDSLPEGMRLSRNNDGSLMIMSVKQDGAEVTMNRNQDQYSGTLSDIQYRIGEAEGQSGFDGDFEHDQTATLTPTWKISPKGTGWEMTIDHLDHGTDIEIVYRAYPEDSVSGWEIENKAEVTADNSLPDDDTATVWVNQPHFAIDKQASNDVLAVNDDVLYEIKVTNSTPGTLARNVVISDLAHTQGVELLHDTIRVYDSEGRDITDSCTINYRHNPHDGETFIVETNRDLVAGMTDDVRDLYEQLMACTDETSFDEVYAQIRKAVDEGHMGADHDSATVAIPGRPVWRDGGIVWLDGSNPLDVDQQSPRPGSLSCETELVVCYRVKIADAGLAGQTVDNTALVVSDEPNTQTTDDEVVDVKGPRLVIDKSSDKDTYQVGETGHYTLVATQTREDNVANDVIVSDLMDERDVASIVHGSVHAVGPDGQAIQAEPAYVSDESGKIVGFTLETGVDLADEESITVTYDVTFERAGTTLHNVAQDNATNAIGGTDDNLVRVVDPYATVTLDKSVDSQTVRHMGWATYTITATVADNPARNVVISDMSLPDSMPIDMGSIAVKKDGVDVTRGSLDWDGNGFSAHVGDCDAGCVVTVTYRAQVRDEALMGTSVVNTATLTSDTLAEPLRDDAHVTIPTDEPEIVLEKGADREVAHVGEVVSYVVEATVPEGSGGAGGVVVSDAGLPADMPVDMASIRAYVNDAEVSPVNALVEGNGFSVNLDDLRPGETVRVAYDATVQDAALAGTEATNVVTLASESLDEPLEATATVRIASEGETTLDKASPLTSARTGDIIPYTVRVVAGADLVDAAIADTGLPEGVTVDAATIRASINGNSLDTRPVAEGTGFSLPLGPLRAGDVVEIAYEAVVGEGLDGSDANNVATLTSPGLAGPVEDAVTVRIDDDPAGRSDGATLEKTADKNAAHVGETVSYLVTAVAETGLSEARLGDSGLPEGARVDEGTIEVRVNGEPRPDLVPVPEGTGFSLGLGTLCAGDVVTVSYRATVEDEALVGESLVNMALLEAAELDDPVDATALVEVTGGDGPGGGAAGGDGGVPAEGGAFPNTGQGDGATMLVLFGTGLAMAAAAARIRQRARRRPRR